MVAYFFFFFQAEDGIRDLTVTGVQTCALPISDSHAGRRPATKSTGVAHQAQRTCIPNAGAACSKLQGATASSMRPPGRPLPFYFGPSDKPLFGCYHKARTEDSRKCAVVICQPVGHEYINCHRALRQLSARLAEAGFPVLRFDYYGCGDSAGISEEGRVSRWLEDISTAIFDLRQRTGLAQTCIVGLRLGGALSTMIGSQRDDVESLVLWSPVVNGKSYLENLFSLQKEMLRFRPKPKRKHAQDHIDVLGFP